MTFDQWFDAQQKADVLFWADAEASAAAWNAALEEATLACRSIKVGHEVDGARNDNEWEDGLIAHGAEKCAHAIRAMKVHA